MKVNVSNERSRVNRDNVMLRLLISSAVLTDTVWVMERGSATKREIRKHRQRERESGEMVKLYNWQLKEAKVEKKLKEGEKN